MKAGFLPAFIASIKKHKLAGRAISIKFLPIEPIQLKLISTSEQNKHVGT